ncbi:MAG: polysaccharide deacetylase family protein [Syntrophobacteraceae bacterium]
MRGLTPDRNRKVKAILGRVAFGLGLHRRLLKDTATVITFHRVNDSGPPDAMNCGVEQFKAYCRFFKKYFRVVSLRQVVDKLERGLPLARELAITFDDGYRDNCTIAAPILKELALPATFFVVTGYIGSQIVPAWDRTARQKHPWMDWEDLASLKQQGFDVGSHSNSHPGFASTPLETLRADVVQSRRILESRLGTRVDLFAYPFGEEWNMPDQALRIVKDAGFRCSAGGFGSVNFSGDDPYHLKRFIVSFWYISPWHLAGEILVKTWKHRNS